MKKREVKKDLLLNFLLCLLIIFTLLLICSFIYFKLSNKEFNNDISKLHNYFNIDNLNDCGGLLNYSNKRVNYDSLTDEYKLCIIYNRINHSNDEIIDQKADKNKDTCTIDKMVFKSDDEKNCNVRTVEKSIIEKEYYKVFGKELPNTKSFNYNNLSVCYLKNDKYYCGLSETSTYIIGVEYNIYRIINKVVEKDDKIIIYDTFIKTDSTNCYNNYTTTDLNIKCNKKYNGNKLSYYFIKKYGNKYKHIYKKNSNNEYYWFSSEPIKK